MPPLPGDLDILFTHPEDEEAAHDLMGKLMPELLKIGLISDVLAQSDGGGAQHESGADGTWSRTCMCIVRLPEQYAPPELPRPLRHRRMDLKARREVLLRASWPSADSAHPPGLPRVAHAVRAAVLHRQRPLQPLHALLGQAGVLNECLFCCPCAYLSQRLCAPLAAALLAVRQGPGQVHGQEVRQPQDGGACAGPVWPVGASPADATHAAQYDTSVPARHERDIFEALQLEYVEPHRRSV